jgi:hypothetical protein
MSSACEGQGREEVKEKRVVMLKDNVGISMREIYKKEHV